MPWRDIHGAPVLEDCARWFVGRILRHFELGDHMGFLLEPLDAATGETAGQLSFQQARDISPGHET